MIENLKKSFIKKEGLFKVQEIHALNGVSFQINKGETLGLAGESGCGKTTTGRCIVRLIEPNSGHIWFQGVDILALSQAKIRPFRKKIQMVFQDPTDSLNPRMTVRQMIAETLYIHFNMSKKDCQERLLELLELVGLKKEYIERFPHQLSMGQQQRVGVARAIATKPEFLVLDEPTSSLDVSLRGHIVKLLIKIQEELGIGYLFISHDLSVVKYLSNRVAIMYLGTIVELADKHQLFNHAIHPYTQALLSAIPIPDPKSNRNRRRIVLEGEPFNPQNLPKGCVFASRCKWATTRCKEEKPKLRDRGGHHLVACFIK